MTIGLRYDMARQSKGPTVKDLLHAIRLKCLDCSGNLRNEVRNCLVKDCPLRPYRGSIESDSSETVSCDKE